MVHKLRVPACLVEKPIATEAQDWRALVALEAESSTKFGVGAQVRYHPNLSRCRETVLSGEVGEVRFVDASAVGTICDQGVHVIDWTMSLIGDAPVVEVFGTASGDANLSHAMHPSPDTTVAKLLFANGVRALWNLGATAPRVCDDPAYYKHCRVAAYGDHGHVLYEEFGRWEIVTPRGRVAGHADELGWAAGNDLAQAALTDAMFEWLDDDAKPVGTSLDRSLAQWNAVLGLYAGTVWRRPVALPFEPPESLWEQLAAALATS
jgi:predicted dehydrogenase